MSGFIYEKDADGIVTITMDMEGSVNAMTEEYRGTMEDTVTRLEAETDMTGVVFASAKDVFFAGGNLNELVEAQPGDEEDYMEGLEVVKGHFRRLEKLPVPVVAAINGAALGGGFELCLGCNYRIAWNHRSVKLGLPEVNLGLLPGAGGIVRTVNMLGLQNALPYIMEGKQITPDKALEAGLINELVDTKEELVSRAKAWIQENKDNDEAKSQPWDRKGHKIPGGDTNNPQVAQLLVMSPAMLLQKTKGLMPAPETILDCAAEAARLSFDGALKVESRGLTKLVMTPVAKNMITTFFFQMNQVNGGASRPKGIDKTDVKKVGVLGAGVMGQGIALVSAMAGIEVVLKDLTVEAAEKGKSYSDKVLSKRVSRGRMNEEKKAGILSLIKPTANNEDLQGCDLIIEAVFEDINLKKKIVQETEPFLAENGTYGSNTSSLPIGRLAEASLNPENFIGIHFFSPVDKMPLVEIICGDKTSQETLAKAFDYSQKIKKTPIVVNDSFGFFTSRTFGSYLDEGVQLLKEGFHPVALDNLANSIGMPLGPLAIYDEVSLSTSLKASASAEALGLLDVHGDSSITRGVMSTMVEEHGRGGRHQGGGFYQYGEDGSKEIWPGLYDLYYNKDLDIPNEDVKDRLLFRQVIEALKGLQEGVVHSVADANIGTIMGIGAPAWTGGLIQFVNTYGTQKFVNRATELAEKYGDRFAPPAIAVEKAEKGELFV
ncbi:3-hydroxyacyl-CoA dehydrogenase NAD-binding domain-containing protein [Endozoicomonas numazuensis]|uniref:3-hydroxyacyl-CoA dehydrogenase n=1 Tax=Endozoicomonas numazuensis TaxID=1137799 RepID=A0A081NMP7_9GAMM|nr:3-hydroxyacyl-CoA dehydrogenase NAD-binding domain-containing protein [Endozoicomonas numazuensis]KEQ19720.1 3-hydroxyacyl-CoA dehydrogenase [Endozoicomonas numazuensis]